MMDPELVDTLSAALEQSERVDEHRILVTPTEDGVALKGAVATPEMSAAALIAEQYAGNVDNQLYVDRNLREGLAFAEPTEPGRSGGE